MPGVASIKWTESNLGKALHAFIGYGCVTIDEDKAQKIAAHMGGGCTAQAIKNLLITRKASFKPGAAPAPAASEQETPKTAKKRKATTTTPKSTKARKNSKGGKKNLQVSEDEEIKDGGSEDELEAKTPPTSYIKRELGSESITVDYDTLDNDLNGGSDA